MSAGARITRTRAYALIVGAFLKLPDAFRTEFVAAFEEFAPRLLARERAGIPTRSGPRPARFAASRKGLRPAGGLASLVSTEIDAGALSLRSGLLTKEARADGFYGYILDAGRGQTKTRSKITRRLLSSKGVVGRYSKPFTRRISPIAPGRYDITFGRVRQWARDEVGPMLGRIADRAILAISWGQS